MLGEGLNYDWKSRPRGVPEVWKKLQVGDDESPEGWWVRKDRKGFLDALNNRPLEWKNS
jgi:hypothetical protein